MKLEKVNLTYVFKSEGVVYYTIKAPIKSYINKLESLFKEYELYPEMGERTLDNNNAKIIEEFKKLGVYKICAVKDVYGTKFETTIFEVFPSQVLFKEDIDKIKFFEEFKKDHQFIGMFWGLNEIGQIAKLDWLPVPNRSLGNSVNLIKYHEQIWLVVFKGLEYQQDILIGSEDLFLNEDEFFSGQKLLEIEELLPEGFFSNVIKAFEIFYVARYKYFFGDHPWKDILEPDEDPDTRAIFLIWLFRLEEQIFKLREQVNKGKTLLFTYTMNDMNNKYVEYNITYTPEIQKEILSKKESLKLYAIVNDYFIK